MTNHPVTAKRLACAKTFFTADAMVVEVQCAKHAVNNSIPAVPFTGCHACRCTSHCISNYLRNGLCCVSDTQADDLGIRICLLVLPPPLGNLQATEGVKQSICVP